MKTDIHVLWRISHTRSMQNSLKTWKIQFFDPHNFERFCTIYLCSRYCRLPYLLYVFRYCASAAIGAHRGYCRDAHYRTANYKGTIGSISIFKLPLEVRKVTNCHIELSCLQMLRCDDAPVCVVRLTDVLARSFKRSQQSSDIMNFLRFFYVISVLGMSFIAWIRDFNQDK